MSVNVHSVELSFWEKCQHVYLPEQVEAALHLNKLGRFKLPFSKNKNKTFESPLVKFTVDRDNFSISPSYVHEKVRRLWDFIHVPHILATAAYESKIPENDYELEWQSGTITLTSRTIVDFNKLVENVRFFAAQTTDPKLAKKLREQNQLKTPKQWWKDLSWFVPDYGYRHEVEKKASQIEEELQTPKHYKIPSDYPGEYLISSRPMVLTHSNSAPYLMVSEPYALELAENTEYFEDYYLRALENPMTPTRVHNQKYWIVYSRYAVSSIPPHKGRHIFSIFDTWDKANKFVNRNRFTLEHHLNRYK